MENGRFEFEVDGAKFWVGELCLAQDELLYPILAEMELGELYKEYSKLGINLDDVENVDATTKDSPGLMSALAKFASNAFGKRNLSKFLSIVAVQDSHTAFLEDPGILEENEKKMRLIPNSTMVKVLLHFFIINRDSLLSSLSYLGEGTMALARETTEKLEKDSQKD